MAPDRTGALFQSGYTLDPRTHPLAQTATKLIEAGFIAVTKRAVVRCAHFEDSDYQYVLAQDCGGVVYLNDALDEEDGGFTCPDCGRAMQISDKKLFRRWSLQPNLDAIEDHLIRMLETVADVRVERDLPGVIRVTATRRCEVCLVDACTDERLFEEADAARGQTIYVVCAGPAVATRLPESVPVFQYLDLWSRSESASLLKREVRNRVGRSSSRLPAITQRPRRPTTAPGLAEPSAEASHFRVPGGTRWNQIAIHRIDINTVAIKVDGGGAQQVTAERMGMAAGGDGRASRTFSVLLKLCEERGESAWGALGLSTWDATKKQVSRLRKDLNRFFGLHDDNPIPTCSQQDGIKTAFRAEPEPPGHDPLSEANVTRAWTGPEA